MTSHRLATPSDAASNDGNFLAAHALSKIERIIVPSCFWIFSLMTIFSSNYYFNTKKPAKINLYIFFNLYVNHGTFGIENKKRVNNITILWYCYSLLSVAR